MREPLVLRELREATKAVPMSGMQIGADQGQLLQLLVQLPVPVAQRVELALLPVDDVAQLLQRALEVRHLEFERVDALAHGAAAGTR